MLTKEDVKKIAKLARITLSDNQIEGYAKDLNNILGYMDILQELNTDNVAETNQVTGLFSITQEDEIHTDTPSREELLACSEQTIDSNMIKVQRSIA